MTLWQRIWGNSVSALLALLLLGWLAWKFLEILILIFAALMLTLCLLPVADKLEQWKIPRALSVPMIMAIAVASFIGILVYILPPVIGQVTQLITVLPENLGRLDSFFGGRLVEQALQTLSGYAEQAGQTALAVTTGVFHFITLVGIVVFLSIYWLIDYRRVKRSIINIFEPSSRKKVRLLADRIETNMIFWLRGQILLSLSVGIIVAIVYSLIGLPFVFVLALLAALLEIIPFLGPILAALPAFMLALTISPTKALLVFISYVVIQAIEGNILVPKVMGGAVHLHPLLVIISFLIGERIAGLIGIFLAIPVVLVLREVGRVYAPKYVGETAASKA